MCHNHVWVFLQFFTCQSNAFIKSRQRKNHWAVAPHVSFAPASEQWNACNRPGQAGNLVVQCQWMQAEIHGKLCMQTWWQRQRGKQQPLEMWIKWTTKVTHRSLEALLKLDQKKKHCTVAPDPFRAEEKLVASSTVNQSVWHSWLALYQRTLAVNRFKTAFFLRDQSFLCDTVMP